MFRSLCSWYISLEEFRCETLHMCSERYSSKIYFFQFLQRCHWSGDRRGQSGVSLTPGTLTRASPTSKCPFPNLLDTFLFVIVE